MATSGDSQSAFRLDTYVNAIQPVSHAFSGFLAIGRSVFAAPIGSGLVAFSLAPAHVRTDNTTPFIQINTEGDIQEPGGPHGNQIATTPFFNIVERNQFGNALGGIRMPDIEVPTETYTAIEFSLPSQQSLTPGQLLTTLGSIFTALETGEITNPTLRDEGLCLLEGYYTPLQNATLTALYPTHSAYVAAFTSAAASDLASGFLTQADYNTAVAAAQASSVP